MEDISENQDNVPLALIYSKWIKLAEERNLLLTPDSYEKLERREYIMVEIDYLNYLYQECRNKYKRTKIYEPQDVYKDLTYKITPTKVITKEDGETVDRCGECDGISMKKSTVTNYGLSCTNLKWDFYTVGDQKWLTTGNGDSHTRWMLWDDLKKMPNVFYKKLKVHKG